MYKFVILNKIKLDILNINQLMSEIKFGRCCVNNIRVKECTMKSWFLGVLSALAVMNKKHLQYIRLYVGIVSVWALIYLRASYDTHVYLFIYFFFYIWGTYRLLFTYRHIHKGISILFPNFDKLNIIEHLYFGHHIS